MTFTTGNGTKVRATLQTVSRRSVVLESYDATLLLRTSEVLQALQIRRGGQIAYDGEAVVTGVVNTGVALLVSATLTSPWLGSLVDRNLAEEAQAFYSDWRRTTRLRESYRLRVTELRSYLSDLKYWLDQVDLDSDGDADAADLPQKNYEALKHAIAPAMTEMHMNLENECRRLEPDEIPEHKAYAQNELAGLLMPAPFYNRVYTKPLGYAGDYQMVNMMHENGRHGQSTYAQIVNYVYLRSGPAEAHRNRIKILAEFLANCYRNQPDRSRPLRILNVGSGPAQELCTFLSDMPEAACDIHLIDFDAGSLGYARSNVERLLTSCAAGQSQVQTTHMSVHDLLRQAVDARSAIASYDVIYCAGLFDYLSDRVCSKLVNLFHKWCNPGGRVLVTNVHEDNPLRGIMEQVMEWHLILRDEPAFSRLAPPNTEAKVYKDSTGINVFLEITKPYLVNG